MICGRRDVLSTSFNNTNSTKPVVNIKFVAYILDKFLKIILKNLPPNTIFTNNLVLPVFLTS